MIMGWQFLWKIAVVAAVLCCVGYYKFVYFLSVGYGYAIAGIGLTLFMMFGVNMKPVHYALCILLFAYGVRLSGFLMYREFKNSAYRKTLREAAHEDKPMPFFVKFCIWISVTVLYVAQTSPLFYRVYNEAGDSIVPWISVGVSIVALVIESLADKQKSDQKKATPNMVATKGLYRFTRCPNYFGEILFWTGITLSGVTAFNHWGQWVMAILAYICIVFIMFNGAQRLEKRQIARYGDMPEYREYADKTPIIIPFLPVYHLNKETGE